MLRHFVPSRELHSLATLVRLSLVDFPSANSMKCCSPPASLKTKIERRAVMKIYWIFLFIAIVVALFSDKIDNIFKADKKLRKVILVFCGGVFLISFIVMIASFR